MKISQRMANQLAEQLNDPDIGGFSVIASGTQAGLPPKNKFVVAQRDVPEGIHTAPAEGAQIHSYAQEQSATLDKPNRLLGGWLEKGQAFVDVPRAYPRTAKGEVKARKSSLRNTQISYGEMGPQRTYAGTTYNPFHERHQDPFFGEHDPEDFDASKYFAGNRQLWVNQPVLQGAQWRR